VTTTTPTTPTPAEPAVTRGDALRLTSVLASGLPPEVGTPEEPATYTVPAVFSRQVSQPERTRIEDPATARGLAAFAGPDLELVVSDRRLLIKNTTLAQLTGGLAAAIAGVLRDIDAELAVEQAQLDDAADVRQVAELARAAAVVRAAAEVRFE
jgi:hypothetical protein